MNFKLLGVSSIAVAGLLAIAAPALAEPTVSASIFQGGATGATAAPGAEVAMSGSNCIIGGQPAVAGVFSYGPGDVADGSLEGAKMAFQQTTDADGAWTWDANISSDVLPGDYIMRFSCSADEVASPADVTGWVSGEYVITVAYPDAPSGNRTSKALKTSSSTSAQSPHVTMAIDPDALPYLDNVGLSGARAAQLKASVDPHVAAVSTVTRYYKAFLDRLPKRAELDTWVPRLESGTTGTTLANALAADPKFVKVAAKYSNGNLVNAAYKRVLGRTPTAEESATAIRALVAGKARTASVKSVADSAEAVGREATEAYAIAAQWKISKKSIVAKTVTSEAAQLATGMVPRVQVVEDIAIANKVK
ncbi:MAG: hypothetical protein JWM89_1857 [Acidimicrobiales bacterium]|nr:hypothetical protein [Acidimicrobiales bacterium]